MTLDIPEKLAFFISDKARYKCAYGGRGAGKSWAVADALIAKSIQSSIRILCTRELQASIKDSVHALLKDRIAHHKVEPLFHITESSIECKNGSLFIFKGLRSNAGEIKSLEGIDYCWVEEAAKVSSASLDYLIPTIRKHDSEIWFTFNTGSELDPVYQRFVVEKRDNCITKLVNYYDNPWFPDVLREDMEYDKENHPERYNNVWLGEPGVEGKFFTGFGDHLREEPFMIEQSWLQGRLFGSLDGGTTHGTSFGLWWIDENLVIRRLFTYLGYGATHDQHAREIYDRIESLPYTHGYFPEKIYADPALWTKFKPNEQMIRSPIDEYIEYFDSKHKPKRFEKANNVKENGCQIMRQLFRYRPDEPQQPFKYWDGLNKSFEEGIRLVETDPNNVEIYAKQDGDDIADESRYGAVACYSIKATLSQRKKIEVPETHLEKLLKGDFSQKSEGSDFYDS